MRSQQTAADIDHVILDVAARIFATYGFGHTSVQEIADAVGYSKPGLLHRFGSKDALHRAVLGEVQATVEEVVAHAESRHEDADQLTEVLTLITHRALDRPGVVQMMLEAFQPTSEEPGIESIQAAGYRLVDALDQSLVSPVERLRVVLALKLIVTAALTQHSPVDADLHVDRAELVPLLVELARGVLRG